MSRQNTKTNRSRQKLRYWKFAYRKRRVRVIVDKVLFLRFLRNIHGRFWGVTAIMGMLIGFGVCFLIKPDMVESSAVFSEFGSDIRTAPYFSGSVFFAAYGLWKWRGYLSRTWRRTMPVTGLMLLTVLGLYLVALMPLAWRPLPYYIHLFGVSLAGLSMLATVVLDGILSKNTNGSARPYWRAWRAVSLVSIIIGGWLTLGSTELLSWYDIGLIGESLMLFGYFLWILQKTYIGEGRRTLISKILRDFVLIS